jgi:hypothetical protein
MSFLRPVEDGSTPPRPSRAEVRARTAEGLRKLALEFGQRERARLEAEQARAAVDSRSVVADLDEELEVLVTEAAAAAMPPVQDGLTLRRYCSQCDLPLLFGREMGSILEDYTWWKESHIDEVCNWIMALSVANVDEVREFFIAHVTDRYHYDRALRASETHGLNPPLRFEDLKQTVRRGGREFQLYRDHFSWSSDVPPGVTSMLAQFVQETAGDDFWLGKYLELPHGQPYDPIIYAEFGPRLAPEAWHVEVARWGDEANDSRSGSSPYSGAR